MHSATRFSSTQVLDGIRVFIRDELSADWDLDPNAPLIAYEEQAAEASECPLIFLAELARYFQMPWNENHWVVWLRLPRKDRSKAAADRWRMELAPRITVRDLANCIAKRAPGVSFAPVTVLGQKCASAGAFLGICRLPEMRGRTVPPSACLRSYLRGWTLRSLWGRVEWISGERLPALRPRLWWSLRNWPDRLAAATLIFTVIAAISIAWLAVAEWLWLGVLAAVIVAVGGLWIRGIVLDYTEDALPQGVCTFADLARVVSKIAR
jgi:hypothetical protein